MTRSGWTGRPGMHWCSRPGGCMRSGPRAWSRRGVSRPAPAGRAGPTGGGAAEQLLAGAGLVAAVRDQLIAEAGGNPLALIELSRGLSGPQRAGSVTPLALPAASPAGRVQQAFAARIGGLPQECRRAMLVAA